MNSLKFSALIGICKEKPILILLLSAVAKPIVPAHQKICPSVAKEPHPLASWSIPDSHHESVIKMVLWNLMPFFNSKFSDTQIHETQ